MRKGEKNNRKKKVIIGISLSLSLAAIVATASIAMAYNGRDKDDKIISQSNIEEQKEIKNSDNKESNKEDEKTEQVNKGNSLSSAQSYAISRFDVEKMLKGKYTGPLENEKTVCLTFDDGPSKNTDKVLNILKDYGVHGTFFVLGEQVKNGAQYIKDIYNSGNAIGNHSYTHDFSKLYPKNKINVDYYMDEYKKTEDELKKVLGGNFSTRLVRMPGGENSREYYKDPNLAELKNEFTNEGIASIDCNALNGDAEGKKYTVEQMVNYVKKSSEEQKHVVVLMHDAATKGLTVEALPQIIEYFKSQGYNFKVIS